MTPSPFTTIGKLPVWHPHPDEYFDDEPVVVTLASGTQVVLDDNRVPMVRVGTPVQFCSICDGAGHGYPGGAPCPLEDRGYGDTDGIWR